MATTTPSRAPTRRGRSRAFTGAAFVAPFLAVFGFAFAAPVVYSLYLSLFRDRLIGGTSFVGLDNYTAVLTDPLFWAGAGRVGAFLLVQVPIMLALALFVALAIDSARLHGAAFFRMAVFLPYAVPGVVAALMWGFLYGDRFGLVGSLNRSLGLGLPDPLSPPLVLLAIGNIVTWQFVGYNMLIFYSALRTVPTSLYEAAALDGAGQWRIIASVKLPALRGALTIATVFSIIGSLQLFNEPSILQPLAPNSISSSFTPNLYAFSLSFSGRQYNQSATVAIVMGVLTMLIAYAVQRRSMREER